MPTRDFYDGWKPRAIKAEPPNPAQLAKFLNLVKTLKPWAASFWLTSVSRPHKHRVLFAYRLVLEVLEHNKEITPYMMTSMMTQDELRAFKALYTLNDKDVLFCGAAILCIRERFMFCSAVHKSLEE